MTVLKGETVAALFRRYGYTVIPGVLNDEQIAALCTVAAKGQVQPFTDSQISPHILLPDIDPAAILGPGSTCTRIAGCPAKLPHDAPEPGTNQTTPHCADALAVGSVA